MKILFLHHNMPGQYKHLARACAADRNNQVMFLTNPGKPDIPGVVKYEYTANEQATPDILRHLAGINLVKFSRHIAASREVWRVCKKMRQDGFVPDIIVGHLGWGNGLFLKDAFPNIPVLSYAEFYFLADNSAAVFLGAQARSDNERARIRMQNAALIYSLTDSDWCITPMFYQRDIHPKIFHSKISVLHEGIDTESIAPDPDATYTLPNGTTLSRSDEVVTYVSPVFEPHRGFPQFMAAAEILLRERPRCHIVAVGMERGGGYGAPKPPGEQSCLQEMLGKVQLDRTRLHLLGPLPHPRMVKVMQISSAHIYLTVPFVLSWSALEAMAAGCLMIGSDTPSVREVIRHEHNGLLVDFFSPEAIARAAIRALDERAAMRILRDNARRTVLDRYALNKVLPLHLSLMQDLIAGRLPPPTDARIQAFHATLNEALIN